MFSVLQHCPNSTFLTRVVHVHMCSWKGDGWGNCQAEEVIDAFPKLPDSSQSATLLWLVVWLACPQRAEFEVLGRTSQPDLMRAQLLIPRHTCSYLNSPLSRN